MESILIQNVTLYDPDLRGVTDLFFCGGKVAAVGAGLSPNLPGVRIIDGRGLIALPGLVDQHVHFTGGGGEGGFRSRVPELRLTDFTTAGVTTAVGLLGTDSATRSVRNLLAKTKALNEEGITAYCLTGAYDVPSPTLTGSLKDDVAFLSECIGVKVALSDHRGGQPTVESLIHMAAQVRLGALTAGKAGVVHIHLGTGKRGLDLVYEALEKSDLPIFPFRPTHLDHAPELAIEFGRRGGMVDFTAGETPERMERCVNAILKTMKKVPARQITLSSDAGGSIPKWSEDRRTIVGMGVGTMSALLPTVRVLTQEKGVPLETALGLVTRNVADGLLLPDKGRLTEGADADALLVDENLSIRTVIARGRVMVEEGKVVVDNYL